MMTVSFPVFLLAWSLSVLVTAVSSTKTKKSMLGYVAAAVPVLLLVSVMFGLQLEGHAQ